MAQPRKATLMRPDVISFNSSISACEKASAWRNALRLLDDLDDIRRLSMTAGPLWATLDSWMEKHGEKQIFIGEHPPQRQVWSPRGVTWFPMISFKTIFYLVGFFHGFHPWSVESWDDPWESPVRWGWSRLVARGVSAGLQPTHGVCTVDRRNGWGHVTYAYLTLQCTCWWFQLKISRSTSEADFVWK